MADSLYIHISYQLSNFFSSGKRKKLMWRNSDKKVLSEIWQFRKHLFSFQVFALLEVKPIQAGKAFFWPDRALKAGKEIKKQKKTKKFKLVLDTFWHK